MTSPSSTSQASEQGAPLTIATDTVCFIIGRLREYDALDMEAESAEDISPLDEQDIDALEEGEAAFERDPLLQELSSFIGDLPEDEQIDLVALLWLGRDSNSAADWASIRDDATQAHNARTVGYLLGTSQAGDYLEDGLAVLGLSCADSDIERL